MTFEDYNYAQYNEHILIDPDLEESDEELKKVSDFQPTKKHDIKDSKTKKIRLIAPNLRGFEEPHYQELLNVRSKEDFYSDQQLREEVRLQKEKEAEELRLQNQAEEEQDQEKTKDSDSDAVSVVAGSETDDEVEYEVFYNINDIRETIKKQEDDPFQDVVNAGKSTEYVQNKWLIEDFAPYDIDQKQNDTYIKEIHR